MHMVPSKDLDPFASLRSQGSSAAASRPAAPSSISEVPSPSCALKTLVAPPHLVQRNRELKVSSARSTHSQGSDNELLSGPSMDIPKTSSVKASMVKVEPKSKTMVEVVEDSKVSAPSSSTTLSYKCVQLPPCSRKIVPASSKGKGKSRQKVTTEDDSASSEVESEDEDENEEEDIAPPPKRLKTTSLVSSLVSHHSVKRVPVPKQVTKAATRPVPAPSPVSAFEPVLLADAQGHLQLPNQSTGTFTPFPKFAHARACSSQSLKCMGSLDVEMAMDALNALLTASTSSTHNLANSLCRATDLNDQLKQIESLFDMTKELYLWSILDLQNAGEDPIVILEAFKAAEPNRQTLNLNKWTLMATLFHWLSPFNLTGLNFNNCTPGEWIDLLCSIYSKESTALINKDRYLVESSIICMQFTPYASRLDFGIITL
ncbi:hypothetical protein F5876DRAFT_82617 [Lentinula aff. lateritia]|uniref:Uncharacterized protein n=1 Tax=Lentinula aff. lateritia TaxID=2804960 RepID=A0ACC1TJA1_9AGAR|nr:hypothetical protein F5876DRAFT_82617 [Lentinula aff. lateritia]